MFLSLLNTNQKKLFLSFAYDLAASDGDFSENERMAIKSYAMELAMEIKIEDVDKDLDHVVMAINKQCGVREKKIIVFEIIGLAMSDYKYDDGEREIVGNALTIFGLDAEFGDFCEKKLTEYLHLQTELNTRILS